MFKKLIGLRRFLLVFLATFTIYSVVRFYSIRMDTVDSLTQKSLSKRFTEAVVYQNQQPLRRQTEFEAFRGGGKVNPVLNNLLQPLNLMVDSTAEAQRHADGTNSRDTLALLTTRETNARNPTNTKTVAVKLQKEGFVTNDTTAQVATAKVATTHVATAMPFARYLVDLNDTMVYDEFLKTNMENTSACENASSYDAIMAVHSAPTNVVKRQAFRWLYADFNKTYPYRVKVLFFLGKVRNSTLQSSLVSENEKYGDLVQGNFIDAYGNLTYKAVFTFKWLNDRCAGFRRLLRLDDDVFLRIGHFFHVWNTRIKNEKNIVMCDVFSNDRVRREGKWLVNKSEIPEVKYNFPHCLGYFVALTPDLVPKMDAAARRTKFFWIDDVFMYGFVAKKVGAKFENVGRDMARWKEKTLVTCLKTRGPKCNIFTLITKPEKFRMLHSLMQNGITQKMTTVVKRFISPIEKYFT